MERKYFSLVIFFVFFFLLSCSGDDWSKADFALLWGVAVNDLNGDGVLDIAATTTYVEDFYADTEQECYVSVLPNNQNSPGDFFPVEEYWVCNSDDLVSVVIGDINDDGLPDIVTEDGRHIFMLFQDSTSPGNFLDPFIILVGWHIEYLAIGDLNEDGFNDIAIAGYSYPHLSILFQDSASPGNFLPLVSIGLSSSSVAIADLNGDFINDIAITGGGVVKLLFQDPAAPGTFFAPVDLAAGASPGEVKIGDLDQDGSLDLVIGNDGSFDRFDGSILILLQKSANPGEFLPAVNYNISCEVTELSLGDLNDDGFLDIAVASWCEDCKITILFQDITNIGTFLSPVKYSCKGFNDPWSIAIGDMNNDNFNDLIISEDDDFVIRFQDSASPGNFLGRKKIYD